MRTPKLSILLMAGLILLITASCGFFSGQSTQAVPSVEAGMPADNPLATASPEPLSTEAQPAAPSSTEVAPASPAPDQPSEPSGEPSGGTPVDRSCEEKVCRLEGTFVLSPPIGQDGRNTIDTSSRFGTLRKRIRDSYYGVMYLNSTGTPVLAAADGTVVYAGDDSQENLGARLNSYGNLVILEHHFPSISEPVYTLYAHLSKITIEEDGTIEKGDQIGLVGMSGSARGSTLYFEVRVGKNAYLSSRNPELWLAPGTDETGDPLGALAGRIINDEGNYVQVPHIRVDNLRAAGQGERGPIFLRTYMDREQRGLSPWQESFAAGSLPEGTYKISFWYRSNLYEREVEVQPGMVTVVNFEVK